jgi:uncharacterized protein
VAFGPMSLLSSPVPATLTARARSGKGGSSPCSEAKLPARGSGPARARPCLPLRAAVRLRHRDEEHRFRHSGGFDSRPGRGSNKEPGKGEKEPGIWSCCIVTTNVLTYLMNFEWDDDKDRANQAKHGISFEEASLIFEGSILSKVDDRFEYGEERRISIGLIREVAAVVVVHTDRDGAIRIISARLANRDERRRYHEHQQRTT